MKEIPTPSPARGEVLIRVHGCGVCHSDLHLVDGEWASWGTPLPIIPGHEVTGIVEKVGEGVTSFAPGDRAGVPWMQYACGRCAPCKAGAEMLCASQRSTGVTVNGGYAEFVAAPEAFTHKIPDGLDLVEAAPLLCAGITVFAPLRRAGNLAGKTVAVAGVRGPGAPRRPDGGGNGRPRGRHRAGTGEGGTRPLARRPGGHRTPKEKIGRALTKMGGADVILLTGISARLFEQCIPGLGPNGTLVILAAIAENASVLPAVTSRGRSGSSDR